MSSMARSPWRRSPFHSGTTMMTGSPSGPDITPTSTPSSSGDEAANTA
jgi:hypothetical protein